MSTLEPLNGKQKRYLKALGHPLSAVIQIGKEGITPSLIAATSIELLHHELIKVKIGSNSSAEKNETAQTLVAEIEGCHLVQIIGKTILLYKENPKQKKEERIRLP